MPLIAPKQAVSNPPKKADPNVKIRNPSLLDFPVYMMCFPAGWDTDDPNNVYMQELTPEEIEENYEKARGQWMTLYGWLTSPQSRVLELPSGEDFPDAVYCANVGIILCHLPKPVAVAANYKSPPRKGEYKVFEDFIKLYGYECYRPPFTWEGEADLKHIRDNIYIGGYGQRTDIRALEWFEKKFDMRIVKCKMTEERLYHWDCCCFPLTPGNGKEELPKALICTEVLEQDEVKEIRKVCEIIDVPFKLAQNGLTNCVRTPNLLLVASSKYRYKEGSREWMADLDKEHFLQKVASENGMGLIAVDLSEFEKSGAMLSCLVMHINRASYWQPIV